MIWYIYDKIEVIILGKDYHKILQVKQNATEEEIKKSYRNLARKYHPDANPGNKDAEEKFKEINEAYSKLMGLQKIDHDESIYDEGTYILNALFHDDIERYNKKRENYIEFLNKMESEFNQYNRSLKGEKEKACKSTWSLLIFDTFDDKKYRIKKELDVLKENAQAFDNFLIFFEEAQQMIHALWSPSARLTHLDEYVNPKNRVSFNPQVFISLENKIRDKIVMLNMERVEKAKYLRQELEKRNLNFETYLSRRGMTEATISISSINTIFKSMKLIDEMNVSLAQFGVTADEFLKSKGRLLIDMQYEELLYICSTITNYINSTKEVKFEDISLLNLEENDVIKKGM